MGIDQKFYYWFYGCFYVFDCFWSLLHTDEENKVKDTMKNFMYIIFGVFCVLSHDDF